MYAWKSYFVYYLLPYMIILSSLSIYLSLSYSSNTMLGALLLRIGYYTLSSFMYFKLFIIFSLLAFISGCFELDARVSMTSLELRGYFSWFLICWVIFYLLSFYLSLFFKKTGLLTYLFVEHLLWLGYLWWNWLVIGCLNILGDFIGLFWGIYLLF